MIAAAVSASLLSVFGWRGIAAVGFAPLVVAALAFFVLPESLRWMVATGRTERARNTAAVLLKRPVEMLPALPATPAQAVPSASFRELASYKRPFWLTIMIWLGISTANYGVYLWGPTIVALVLGIAIKDAASVFVWVALSGIVGKIGLSFLSKSIGRRATGQLAGVGIAVVLGAAGLLYDQTLLGTPVFIILIVAGALFFDGAFANAAPYAAEVFPVRLAARGTGLAQAANGIGKILGPISMGLIAGSSSLLTPAATTAAILPCFLFLAACGLLSALAFTLIPIETAGRPLDVGLTKTQEPLVAGGALSPQAAPQ
jgi:putative MFS transporter